MLYAVFYASLALGATVVLGMYLTWQRRQQHAVGRAPRPTLRSGLLKSGPGSRAAGWLLGMLCAAVPLAATALVLARRWQNIPQRFPIHWGIEGRPNGWADRGVVSVFGTLVVGALTIMALVALGELIARSSPGHKGRSAMIGMTRRVLVASAWLVTLEICAVSLLPLAPHPAKLVPLIAIGAIVFTVGLLAWVVCRSFAMRETMFAAQDSTDGRFWKGGLIYYNPEDSALMVPKRQGFGYTINFGRPASWLIMGAIFLIPMTVPFLLHLALKQ